jgi:hypothetical protein
MLLVVALVVFQLVVNFEKERRAIGEIAQEPSRAVCIGRMLIDLPVRLEPSYGTTYFGGWRIKARIESLEVFRARLLERVDGLSVAKNGYGNRSLEMSRDPEHGWEGKLLQFGRESLKSVDNHIVSYEDTVKIEGLIHSQGVSFDISGGVSRQRRFDSLVLLLRKFKIRGHDEIPEQSGFCFDRGIILGNENPSMSEGITVWTCQEFCVPGSRS